MTTHYQLLIENTSKPSANFQMNAETRLELLNYLVSELTAEWVETNLNSLVNGQNTDASELASDFSIWVSITKNSY